MPGTLLGAIMWLVPARGEEIRRLTRLLGGAAILGGIIGWLAFDGDDLLDPELIGPGW